MKTSIHKTLATICAVVISINASAQHRSRGNETLASTYSTKQSNASTNSTNNQKYYGGGNFGNNNGNKKWNGWNSGVTINIGTPAPFGYNNYGNNYYNNYYSSKRATRIALNRSANVIREALRFSNWNDTYSPWLAKAIRHQQFAKQQYFWGNYAAAINHSERAGFLAWNTLQYFNNGFVNNNGFNDNFGYSNYQDPYQNPNNPYYKKGTSSSSSNNNEATSGNIDDDFGYKKANTNLVNQSGTAIEENNSNFKSEFKTEELDMQLPQQNKNDKELLKMSANDLDLE